MKCGLVMLVMAIFFVFQVNVTGDNSEYVFKRLEQIQEKKNTEKRPVISLKNTEENKSEKVVYLTVTVAGDCTLGRDDKYSYANSFNHELEKQNNDYSYFFRNVRDIFADDDLTIVNLESPLTNSVAKADKEFSFKGLPEFTEIIKSGNIEAVTIANNHTYDYQEEGYFDTLNNLKQFGIIYFGNDYTTVIDVKSVKVGMFGNRIWADSKENRNSITRSVKKLKEQGAQLIIAYYHWGDEGAELPNEIQKSIAHFSVDSGVDLVLGSHPHVLQGVEEYNGKQIIYSLGNFSFGGNRNPPDKDAYIFQQTFSFYEGILLSDMNVRVIPVSISSVKERNNFQPTPLHNDEYIRVRDKIIERSLGFNNADALLNMFLKN